jgi:hypothetical protein
MLTSMLVKLSFILVFFFHVQTLATKTCEELFYETSLAQPSASTVRHFLKKSQAYSEKILKETYEVLVDYTTSSGAGRINEGLRSMKGRWSVDASFNKELRLIDEAIDGAPELPVNMSLMRVILVDSSKGWGKKLVGNVGDVFISKS